MCASQIRKRSGDMQVAIITGASSGIGFGTAVKFAEAGIAVLGVGRDANKLAALEKAIGNPDLIETLAVVVTEDDAPQRIVKEALARWHRTEFLINHAGAGSPRARKSGV